MDCLYAVTLALTAPYIAHTPLPEVGHGLVYNHPETFACIHEQKARMPKLMYTYMYLHSHTYPPLDTAGSNNGDQWWRHGRAAEAV